ncbi:hypothetical protein B0T18DRAFT_417189 [Schizothecium vesticola]|uniref:RanBP2-type domain-containing protein n=1 Tax=Schizothecium vesticola TaxID=314040 RepID=A0AA40EFV4_9PEZI|nr:hypothetical protein B0T18DRAFT_417189 [Schizothecium vesticola]
MHFKTSREGDCCQGGCTGDTCRPRGRRNGLCNWRNKTKTRGGEYVIMWYCCQCGCENNEATSTSCFECSHARCSACAIEVTRKKSLVLATDRH